MKAILRGIPLGPLGAQDSTREKELVARFRGGGQRFHDYHDRLFAQFMTVIEAKSSLDVVVIERSLYGSNAQRDWKREAALDFFITVLRQRGYDVKHQVDGTPSEWTHTVTITLK